MLVLIGSAPCANGDIKRLERTFPHSIKCYMAVGVDACASELVVAPSQIRYVVTYHVSDIPGIKEVFPKATLIAHIPYPQVDFVCRHSDPSGSSALLGALAGIEMGFKHIVLCGCPLIGKNKAGRDYNKQFSAGWVAKHNQIQGIVKSMSGWTREILGEPSYGWINT